MLHVEARETRLERISGISILMDYFLAAFLSFDGVVVSFLPEFGVVFVRTVIICRQKPRIFVVAQCSFQFSRTSGEASVRQLLADVE